VFVATQRHLAAVPAAARASIACAITAVVTSLSWLLIERPFLRWKRRLDERAPGPALAPVGALGTVEVVAGPGIDEQPPDRPVITA
jgi:peptidoglycan/LPS O-acetylase OafA/YrhL